MFRTLTTLSILALMTTGTATFAQTDTNEQPTEAEAATGQSQLDLGQPVSEGPALGERYSKEKHGDWDMACIKTEAETDPCSLLQILKDDKGNAVAEMSLFRLEAGGQAVAGATMIVPLETLLTARLTIAIDGSPGKQYQFSYCNPIGCFANIGLTQADIDALKRGNSATVSIVPAPAPDEVIQLPMSLKGFTAGYDVVDVVANR
ncbi:MAG: invasion associated locus B family protein [Rhodobacteraceae bacterium]|nr:invasion associated locus B family protein [Paracoccaceae bacterium]